MFWDWLSLIRNPVGFLPFLLLSVEYNNSTTASARNCSLVEVDLKRNSVFASRKYIFLSASSYAAGVQTIKHPAGYRRIGRKAYCSAEVDKDKLMESLGAGVPYTL